MRFEGRILAFRFSAMGDVAMSAAVVREFVHQNPAIQVVMVSRSFFEPFFADIKNVVFHPLDTKEKHKGAIGLYRLFQELKTYEPIAIADLHNNLRSRILSSYFRFARIPIARIDKNRKNKKALTRKYNKIIIPLRRTVEAYADVFLKLGFSLKLSHQLSKSEKELPPPYLHYFKKKDQAKIGISPFAQHDPKVYPLDKMEIVIENLSNAGHQLFIFGGGDEEKIVAEEWERRFQNVNSLIGKVSLKEELALISHLNVMLSMDSAGMHLASLMGVEVVSIWGATHPYAGFLGYGQKEEDCIQIDLYCRPCSVYGSKPCYRGDHACMQGIDSGIIIARINKKIGHD
jgi:ADP-heptose:LPS heptosyltransferase